MKQQRWIAAWAAVALSAFGCSADPKGTGGSSGFGGAGGGAAFGGASGTGGGAAFGGTGGGAAFGGFGGASGLGGAGGGGGAAGGSCAMGSANASRVTPTVMLVVDGSCSMSTEYPGDGTADMTVCTQSATNRWSALRNALVDPTNGVVSRMQGVVNFGLGVYGTVGTGGMQCPFVLGRIEPTINNLNAITAGLPALPPGLSTPTPEALTEVMQSLPDVRQTLDSDIGPQIVILATDGAPNGCDFGAVFAPPTQNESLAAAMIGQAKGIQMFVISLAAPSNAPLQAHLQQMANVGAGMDAATGNATLFAPTDPANLSLALEQIVAGALGCDVALNGRVAQGRECDGTVTLNSTPLPCNDPNGWRLVAEDRIQLQGLACDEFKANTASMVNADFPCNIFVPD